MAKGVKKAAKGADQTIFDPLVASLFSSSSGPVIAPSHNRYDSAGSSNSQRNKFHQHDESDANDEEASDGSAWESSPDPSPGKEQKSTFALGDSELTSNKKSSSQEDITKTPRNSRKRKRNIVKDDLEERYLHQLSKQDERQATKDDKEASEKRQKLNESEQATSDGSQSDAASESGSENEDYEDGIVPVPQHESLNDQAGEAELDKAARTVFLGNVSTEAITSKVAKRTLLTHLSSCLSDLQANNTPHKVESLRFRSTAFSSVSLPKRAAFAKKELMDATTKSTNAYAVYSTQAAAREAAKRLNGTIVLNRHLRVDQVAHPSKIDHRRCVFVGNLGFVDDESTINAAQDNERDRKPRKARQPGDVEEGLWRQFSNAGTVESVRVVRDSKTRVGKGFAYVQFMDENGVEAALLYNEKSFPPMLPRKLRVTRAKSLKKIGSTAKRGKADQSSSASGKNRPVYTPKATSETLSLQGRAHKLLGRAGKSKLQHSGRQYGKPGSSLNVPKPPESFVFEGHRASSQKAGRGTQPGRSGKKRSKPQTRSSRRAAAWRAEGHQKAK